jgi:hypothetical protein
MLNVLFWNLNRKDLGATLADVAKDTSASIVVVTEAGSKLNETLVHLKSRADEEFLALESEEDRLSKRFQLFSSRADLNLVQEFDADRMHVRRLRWKGLDFLLAFVHGVDPRNHDQHSRRSEAERLAAYIKICESRVGHRRTFVVGDFNMNPFDPGMRLPDGFNGRMVRRAALTRSSSVQAGLDEADHAPEFYNPMWGCFGDRTPGPPGSFYHPSRTNGLHGWNMLDQVLVRPQALDWFRDVQILTTAADVSLASGTGRPSKRRFSDHFPILLTIGDGK